MRKECAKKDKVFKLKVLPELSKLHKALQPPDALDAAFAIFETITGFDAAEGESGADR